MNPNPTLEPAATPQSAAKPVTRRGLIVLLALFSGLLLLPSGILLHLQRENGVTSLSHVMMAVHNLCAVIFVVSTVPHILFNRKPLARYFSKQLDSLQAHRRMAVFAALFSGLMLPPSGILLHLQRENGLTSLGHAMMAVHNLCAFIFVVATVWHVVFNRKPLVRYFSKQVGALTAHGREAFLAAGIVLGLVGLALLHGLH